jgi:ATP-binding cassette subfamily F protein 3
VIQLRNVTLRRGAKVLLDGVSVTINPGEKVGLVGRNGAGKSTLFALLNGSLHEDAGDFARPAHWQLAQVAQHMPETDEPATDFVLAGDTRLMALREQLTQAEESEDGIAIAHAHSDLADAGEHDAVPRAQSLILGLGFRPEELDRPVNSFSGGWRMRLQLARALMAPSDLLLLDEPTNHLDLDALVWLEAWLQRYAGTLVVISHDREFLDAVTNVTLHIENQQLTRYGSNYSGFELLRAQQLEQQQAAFSKQKEKIAHLQKFIDRFKAKASKAKQAQSRVKALERMEKIAPVLADAEFTFEFKEPANLPNPMLAIADASFGYEGADAPKVILRSVNKSVMAGQRIGILGANGQGKSTLVKTIARTMPPLDGSITEGKGLAIGYFAQQELDVLRPQDNPLEHMTRMARELGPGLGQSDREQDLRNFLGQFLFSGDMVKQSVGSMSGGEKARLVLAMIVWQRPNLLLLDEPTNHLDLATREALAMALNEFEGTVMLVSHDRALLRRCATSSGWSAVAASPRSTATWTTTSATCWTRPGGCAWRPRRGPLPPLRPLRPPPPRPGSGPGRRGPAPAERRADPQEQRRQQAQQRQQLATRLKPLKKELEQSERRIATLEGEKSQIEARLSGALPPQEIAEAGRRLKAVGDELAQLEERWLALSGEIEAAESAQA